MQESLRGIGIKLRLKGVKNLEGNILIDAVIPSAGRSRVFAVSNVWDVEATSAEIVDRKINVHSRTFYSKEEQVYVR